MYDVPPVVNDTLSRVEDVIHQEKDKDQGVIFPERGNNPDAIDINKNLEQRTPYTWQVRAREQEDIW